MFQFQVLAESSGQYEPGGQYMEYIRRLPATNYIAPQPFTFQQYNSEVRSVQSLLEKTHHSSYQYSFVCVGFFLQTTAGQVKFWLLKCLFCLLYVQQQSE